MNNNGYDLYCKFNADKHKEKYTNYLEVVIDENGEIMYAVPSHQEKVKVLACEKLGVTKTQLDDMCPQEYYFDYLKWLCIMSKSVAVWNEFCYAIEPNKKQIQALQMLKEKGIYKGMIPNIVEKKGEKQKNE